MKITQILLATFILSIALLSSAASAAVVANLSFTTPTGTVGSTDTIEVWGTLSLDSSSDPLTFDRSIYPNAGLPNSLMPSMAEGWNPVTLSFDKTPFASYTDINPLLGIRCSGTFVADKCADGEYHISPAPYGSPSVWGGTNFSPLIMSAGESRDFLLWEFTPTDGNATPGNYFTYDAVVGFFVRGLDVNGNAISQQIRLASTCPIQNDSCAFTRTVVSSVPLPTAAWLLGSGLLGLVGVARKCKSA